MMIWLLLLMACGARPAPPVYHHPIPPMEYPVTEDAGFEPTDDCAEIAGYKPGSLPPFLASDGTPACRGLVVPQGRYVEMIRAEGNAEFWQARARICQRGRESDRQHCELISEGRWAVSEDHRQEANARRAWGNVAAGGAFVLGVGIGVLIRGLTP